MPKKSKVKLQVLRQQAKQLNEILLTQTKKNGGRHKSKKAKYETREIDNEIKEFK